MSCGDKAWYVVTGSVMLAKGEFKVVIGRGYYTTGWVML